MKGPEEGTNKESIFYPFAISTFFLYLIELGETG